MVDGVHPSYEVLAQISQRRPVIVLINKWDLVVPSHMKTSLRHLVQSPDQRIRLYGLLDRYRMGAMGHGLDLQPFLDATPTSLVSSLIPFSAKTGWGLDLLKSWIRGISRTLITDQRKYLYRVGEDLKFRPIGALVPQDLVRVGGHQGMVEEFFIEHRGIYSPRKQINLHEDTMLLLLNPHEAGVKEDSVLSIQTLTPQGQGYIPKIKALISKDLPQFKVYIYGNQEPKNHVLRNLCHQLGWPSKRISPKAWDKFQQDLGAGQVETPLVVLGTKSSSPPLVGVVHQIPFIGLSNPSCITLFNLLEESLGKIKELLAQGLRTRYEYDGVVQLMAEHKFYQTRSLMILGGALVHGKIHPGSDPLMVLDSRFQPTGHRVEILGIQQNNVSHTQWKDRGKLIALKLKLLTGFTLRQDTYFLVYQRIFKELDQYRGFKHPDQEILRYYGGS